MTVAVGSRFGPYEILAPLGAGGMGEVYRARDSRLERTVAVKVLPSPLARPEARLRFEREARAISQLSHPHICTLFDVGHQDGIDHLVMELLEGETLYSRLTHGPLGIDEVLRHAIAICGALEAAHRSGIVHRDLKPHNVMLTKSGAKLLDFGLAKPASRAFLATDSSRIETASARAEVTTEGTVVGTLHYMAPEQLEGRPTDARTDIFALGCVLYEMLASRRPFEGRSAAAVASAILKSDPGPVSVSRPDCPPSLERLVTTCLAKQPDDRWQSAHDVKLQLGTVTEPAVTATAARASRARGLAPWILTGAAVSIAAAALFLRRNPAEPAVARMVRFSIPPPDGRTFANYLESTPIAASPDGTQVALVLREPGGDSRVWLRPLSSVQARPMEGTSGATGVLWSPDSRSIAFFASGQLKRLDLASGVTQVLCEVPTGTGLDGTWSSDDQILFSTVEGEAIFRLPAAGGTPTALVQRDTDGPVARVHWPRWLPGGRRFLYLAHGRQQGGDTRVMLGEVGRESRELLPAQSSATYVEPGYLLFVREGTLLGQRFDAGAGRLAGEPFAVAEPVLQFFPTGAAVFSASRNGMLVYASQGDVSRLSWFDRSGTPERLESTIWGGPGVVRLSPDGREAVFGRGDARTGALDLWTLDVARKIETRLTSGPETEALPLWLRDGRHVVYSAVREGRSPHLFQRDVRTGEEHVITPLSAFQQAYDVSPDGRTLVYGMRGGRGFFDLYAVQLPDGSPTVLLATPFDESDLRFSPDGRNVAFVSNDSGRSEVFVAPYPRLAEKSRVSLQGGGMPRWSHDGRSLFYVSPDDKLLEVPIRAGATVDTGTPRTLFALSPRWLGYDVSADDKRFLASVPEVVASQQPVTVVLNWRAERVYSPP